MLTAIPTAYQGVSFRSRQEARWAMVFDFMEIEWQYETEGYQLATCWYLPDFWLAGLKAFVEVKGSIDQWDIQCEIKASDLVKESGIPLIVLHEISAAGLMPTILIPDPTLPWGYEVYCGNLPESALRNRLWLDKEPPDWTDEDVPGFTHLLPRIESIRRHRF